MRVRTSLFAKLVLWFFLSIVILLGTYAVLFRVQFGIDMDSPLRGSVGDRALDVAWDIAQDMGRTPSTDWGALLDDYGDQYGLTFHVVNPHGESMLPEGARPIPEAAQDVMLKNLPPHERRERHPRPGPHPRPDPEPDGPPPPPQDGASYHAPMFTFRTDAPTRYWAVVRAGVSVDGSPPRPSLILMESESITGNGLFWTPFPWILAVVVFLLLSTLLWLPLSRSLVVAIRRMTKATERIAEGDFDVTVDETRRDELGRLGHSINRMARRLEGHLHGQKRFLGDIAHELASPIGRLNLSLGILEQACDDERSRPRVERALREVENLSNLVNELLSFSRAEIGKRQQELAPVALKEVIATATARERRDGVEISEEVPDGLHAMAVPGLLVRALSNVLRNAVRYAGAHGPIRVVASREADRVVIEVVDEGPGVPEEALDHLFKPFFRVEESRNRETGGVGLGLAIVDTCVSACQGRVSARNMEPRGFKVSISLQGAESTRPADRP